MDVEQVYCPGCNHSIRITRTPDHRDGQASLPDGAELVCLDFGEGCSSGRCPVTGKAGVVMGVRLARSHLREEPARTVSAPCEGCGRVAELEVVDGTWAVCPLCGTTNRWVMLELASGSRIAVTVP